MTANVTVETAADCYPRVANVVPAVEWATMADDVDAGQAVAIEGGGHGSPLVGIVGQAHDQADDRDGGRAAADAHEL